jgi:hypothetical protein
MKLAVRRNIRASIVSSCEYLAAVGRQSLTTMREGIEFPAGEPLLYDTSLRLSFETP